MTFPGSKRFEGLKYSPWTKVETVKQMFVAEASDLSANGGNDLQCPHCGVDVPSDQWRDETNAEGEVVLWQHMCSCGTLLKVFND